MLWGSICMEPHLDELPNSQMNLMRVGALHARDVHALCNDVAAMIFPTAVTPPTEAMISAVTNKLVALVADIEAQLTVEETAAPSGMPQTWALLAKSGFLRERDLVDFVLARVAEDRLEQKLNGSTAQLPAKLLDHPDPNVADAAQSLLAADSLHRRARRFSHQALRPELLHQLCWRIVAALEITQGQRNAGVIANARSLLTEYDEGRTAAAAARKIVHFLEDDRREELMDPGFAGVHLFTAYLANKLAIEQDHILHLVDIHSSMPFAVMLRALGWNAEQAMAVIYLFKGYALTPRDIAMFNSDFEHLQPDDALAEVQKWAQLRTQFLLNAPMDGA